MTATGRVVHVIERMHLGGAERVVLEHARHAAAGWPVGIIGVNGGGWAMEAAAALGVPTLALERAMPRVAKLRVITGWLRRERAALVNGHNATGGLYGTLAAALAGLPAVRTEHSIPYPGRHSSLYPLIEGLATTRVRRVVCVCEASRRGHAARQPWARGKFVTVANGISDSEPRSPRESVRAELGVAPDTPVVLSVASLTPQKAQHVLIGAFSRVLAQLPDAVLLLAGAGPARPGLEASAAPLGSSVRFLGARRDVPDLLVASDLFVLSSAREGLPIVLLEAMRAGRPAVATRIGGIPEAIVPGETGCLVELGDEAGLAHAVARLLRDPALGRRMGEAAEQRWRERFTASRMVRETERIYGEVLGLRLA